MCAYSVSVCECVRAGAFGMCACVYMYVRAQRHMSAFGRIQYWLVSKLVSELMSE